VRLIRPLTSLLPAVAIIGVAGMILAGLALLPVRTWMSQRNFMAETQAELTRTEGEVQELQARLTLSRTDAEVERLARENFDLVFPGEESYRILPAPETRAADTQGES
jgi:hypothetical protein